ncbi:hypothetical protein FOL46_006648 [Perkinsus olseni]|uniref:AAA+ ATPase domain-containing protein n=1 Tax=Perkinsus olseni TaxID=32597 RepID=A0A7J6LJD8_PEROL|nr:hypothetical protein FOL46_006648 [Perkinsus olseni]
MDDIQDAVNSGVNMGLTSLLRSGNKYRDLALCIAVPIAMKVISDRQVLTDLWETVKSAACWATARPDEVVREISFLEGQNLDTNSDDSSVLDTTQRNNILQKALRLYMEETYRVGANNMEVFLVPNRTIKLEKDRYGDACMFTGNAQQLQSYEVTRLPSKGYWILIDEAEDLWFKQEETVDNVQTTKSDGDNKTTTNNKIISFSIKSRGAGAGERVDRFIAKAYDWYVQKKMQEADGSRYFYIRTKQENEFKKYRLSDCKSFDSLFFPEKEALIKLVDDFVEKRGKFAISGFPNKLGLLLDGPPGTGKTSLIKALANYTNRNVVCVSLEKVKTNQELMDILFDLSFPVKGDDEPPKLDFKDIIFVMEDVDAASKVVYSRGVTDKEGAHREDLKDTSKTAEDSMSMAASESGEDAQPSMERLIHAVTTGVLAAKNMSDDRAPSKVNFDSKDTSMISLFDEPDKLSLSGLLNALDGIVDSPGRILVMTTNHPDRLDPALIRPGRINKRIHMGWMLPDMATEMLSHYLGARPSVDQQTEIDHLFRGFNISPATLEQTCAEFDTIGEVLDSLKSRLKEEEDDDDDEPSFALTKGHSVFNVHINIEEATAAASLLLFGQPYRSTVTFAPIGNDKQLAAVDTFCTSFPHPFSVTPIERAPARWLINSASLHLEAFQDEYLQRRQSSQFTEVPERFGVSRTSTLQTGAVSNSQDQALRRQLALVEAEIARENQEFEATRKQNAEHIERMESLKDELALQNQRLQQDVIELEKEADDREEHSKRMQGEIERLTELLSHRERLIQAERENVSTLVEGIRRQREDLDKLLKHNAATRARIQVADADILQLRQEAAELEVELRTEDHTLQELREKKNKMERRFRQERQAGLGSLHREYQEELMELQNKNREARILLADREAKLDRNRRCISASEILALSEGTDESKENHRLCRFDEDTAIINNCLDRGREKYLKEILSMMKEAEGSLEKKSRGLREAIRGKNPRNSRAVWWTSSV